MDGHGVGGSFCDPLDLYVELIDEACFADHNICFVPACLQGLLFLRSMLTRTALAIKQLGVCCLLLTIFD